MAKLDRVDIEGTLTAVFAAERSLREQSQTLLQAPHGALLGQIRRAYDEACAIGDEPERSLRLVCLTRILRSVPGPGAIDLLIDILSNDSEEARQGAGFVLDDVACDRMGEVRKGIERALKRLPKGSVALCELPFVILGLGDADVYAMLRPFLSHEDPEAVAAAIEAFVEYADPAAIELLEPLTSDKRPVQIEDESTGDSEQMTVGDLALDAIDALQEVERMMASDTES
jgi:HEAT repeat protein